MAIVRRNGALVDRESGDVVTGNRNSRILVAIAVGLVSVIATSGAAQAQSGTQVSADERRANTAPAPAARDRAGQSVTAGALADSGPWRIVNSHSGRCLTVQNASTADNALALQFGCEHTAPFNEEWQLVP